MSPARIFALLSMLAVAVRVCGQETTSEPAASSTNTTGAVTAETRARNFVYTVLLLGTAVIWVLFIIFVNNRFLAFIVRRFMAWRLNLREGETMFTVRSLSLSIVSGTLSFKGLKYITADYGLTVPPLPSLAVSSTGHPLRPSLSPALTSFFRWPLLIFSAIFSPALSCFQMPHLLSRFHPLPACR